MVAKLSREPLAEDLEALSPKNIACGFKTGLDSTLWSLPGSSSKGEAGWGEG